MTKHWTQYANIRKWLYKSQPKTVVEIGALDGENTKNLASLIPDIGYKLTVLSDDVENKLDGVDYIKGVSYKEIPKFEDNSIDFAIIDTDHNYWTLMQELIAIHPKMKEDGIIVMHDVDYYYYNSGESTFYADGSEYPLSEIEQFRKEFGGMGHALIDFLSQMKRSYKLELWVPEECGVAIIRKLPWTITQLVLRPGYEGLEGRKVAIGK